MALIHIEDIFVAYGSPARAVLAGIDLEIEEGSFVCVLGQTGCGKSTLLRLVLGCEHPLRGRVLIDGTEHPQPDRSRGRRLRDRNREPDRGSQGGQPGPVEVERLSDVGANIERPAVSGDA